MIIDFFLLADAVSHQESGKVDIIGGGVGHVTVPSFPGRIPPLVAVGRVGVEPGDRDKDHTVLVRVRTEVEGDEFVIVDRRQIESELINPPHPIPASALPAILVVVPMPSRTAERPDWYTVELEIDDQVLAKSNFLVWDGTDPGLVPARRHPPSSE